MIPWIFIIDLPGEGTALFLICLRDHHRYQHVTIVVSAKNSILCGIPPGVDEHRSSSNTVDPDRSNLLQAVIKSLRPKPSQISIALEHPNNMCRMSSASVMQAGQLTV
jgi:hypothetical protein